MKAAIDKAGRVVIPRQLRARIGLAGGGQVEITVDGAAIRLEPVAGEGLVEEAGFLVIPTEGVVLDDATVRDLRHADQR